ncbi:MAG TPA: FliM/FliN family flagellar motor switch protein [Polyangiaceae bacterium]|jgi:type III secretion system YscQ/HrcQ family protein|nr:FliM/FliN family flagellar motor switch protein [Polyangiaceae bacterium]
MAPAVQPFPWRSLETLPAANVGALRDVRRWAAHRVRLEGFGAALSDLVGARVQVRVRRATPRAAGPPLDGGVALVLARERDAGGPIDARGAALVAIDGALATALVARVLRRPLAKVSGRLDRDAAGPVAGAVAAVVMAAARRAPADGPLPVVIAAGAAEDLEPRFVDPERAWLAVALTVLVDDDAFDARAVVARDVAETAAPPAWTPADLASLGGTPLGVPLVACTTTMTLAALGELRAGDALLPGSWRLAASAGRELTGEVVLAAPSASAGVRARLVEGGRLVLSGEVVPLGDGAGDNEAMTDSDGKEPLLDTLGDVPVVVRVEIGEARMAAREWASLGPGDVVTLGRRVGELVVLRVGGVPVARGELVNVEGEVGVRIAERIGARPSEAPTDR